MSADGPSDGPAGPEPGHGSTTIVLPAAPRRPDRAGRSIRWWGRAWDRAVEEAAYAERDLAAGRSLVRAGRLGRISVEPGHLLAAVEDVRGLWAVAGRLPVLDPDDVDALVEAVAAAPDRLPALLGGDLPLDLVEHAEETGVELLPAGSDLETSCTCRAWTQPCVHALAVLVQLGRLLEADPLVLLHLRGLPRDQLLARVHARDRETHRARRDRFDPGSAAGPDRTPTVELDLDTAQEAARRAAAWLAELEAGPA